MDTFASVFETRSGSNSSSRMLWQTLMHSSQIYTPGPAIIFCTRLWGFPQKEHLISLLLSFLAIIYLMLVGQMSDLKPSTEAASALRCRFHVICAPEPCRSGRIPVPAERPDSCRARYRAQFPQWTCRYSVPAVGSAFLWYEPDDRYGS